MPTKHSLEEEAKDDGSTREKLVVEFNNGSLEQLRDLARFFGVPNNDPYELLIFAIGFMERIKESDNNKQKESSES